MLRQRIVGIAGVGLWLGLIAAVVGLQTKANGSDVQNPIGRWRSVDFVRELEDFEPGGRKWKDELFLKDVRFMRGGKTSSFFTWKKGWIHHYDGTTKAQYVIREIDGSLYLFLPWLSGDVTKRGQKPWYYVMEKVGGKQARNDKSLSTLEHPKGKRSAYRHLPTKEAGPVEWKGNKIVSRVLPYPDFTSLFIRLPIAHAIATGQGVKVAVAQLSGDDKVISVIKQVAPRAEIKVYTFEPSKNKHVELAKVISEANRRVAVIPDVHLWPKQAIVQLAEQLFADEVVVIIPSDLSEDEEKIKTVNALHSMGALAVGRVDRQSLVMESTGNGRKPFNRHIRDIQTDLFSTVGVQADNASTNPVASAGGVAALVLEKWPDLTGAEVRDKMIAGAREAWQATSIETGQWNPRVISIDHITTKYTPTDENAIFRFRVLDAAGSLEVDTEIPWFLNMLNCGKAWEITKGQGVVAAVSDQGFHIKHPELINSIKTTMHFGPLTLDRQRQNFHGTDMSRILLSVAPEAKIIPVLCSGDKEEFARNIAKSFLYAGEQKADVITASWAGWFNKNEELLSAIRKAVDSGVVVSWIHYPKRYPGLLRPTFTYSTWQQQPCIGFADRFLTDEPGFHPVEIEAGLSGTAPQATGIAALAKSVNPKLTPTEIEKLIFENSTDIGYEILIPDAYKIVLAARGQSETKKDNTIETIAKESVRLLVSGDCAKVIENFDETMKKELPADKLKAVWDSLIGQVGAFVEQTAIRKEKVLAYDVVFVTCKFEKAVLDTKVVFDSKKQIAGLFFVPAK